MYTPTYTGVVSHPPAAGGFSPGGTQGGLTVPQQQLAEQQGYYYDPVVNKYVRSPTSAGARVNQYESAAFPQLNSVLNGLTGGGTAGSTTSIGGTAFGMPGVGGVGSGASGPVSAGGGVAPLQMPDMSQSNAATFAAAKDKVGQSSRAALDSLNGLLGSTGQLGGGASVLAARDVVNNNAEQLGQVDRDLANTNAATALDVAKTNYGGALTQRQQDIQAQEANASLALQANNQRYQLLDLVLKGLSGAGSTAASALY